MIYGNVSLNILNEDPLGIRFMPNWDDYDYLYESEDGEKKEGFIRKFFNWIKAIPRRILDFCKRMLKKATSNKSDASYADLVKKIRNLPGSKYKALEKEFGQYSFSDYSDTLKGIEFITMKELKNELSTLYANIDKAKDKMDKYNGKTPIKQYQNEVQPILRDSSKEFVRVASIMIKSGPQDLIDQFKNFKKTDTTEISSFVSDVHASAAKQARELKNLKRSSDINLKQALDILENVDSIISTVQSRIENSVDIDAFNTEFDKIMSTEKDMVNSYNELPEEDNKKEIIGPVIDIIKLYTNAISMWMSLYNSMLQAFNYYKTNLRFLIQNLSFKCHDAKVGISVTIKDDKEKNK